MKFLARKNVTSFNVNYRNLLNDTLEHIRAAERGLSRLLESPAINGADFDDVADEVNLAGVKLRYIRLELAEKEEVPDRDPDDDTLSPDD